MRNFRFYLAAFGVVTAVVVFSFLNVAGAADKAQRSSLTGLSGIHVVVEKIDPELNTPILDTRTVQREIEATLAAAGVKVFDEDTMLKTTGMPYLYVNLSTAKAGMVYAYHVQIEVRQGAFLERDPNIIVTSATWNGRGITGMVAISEINMIRTQLDDSVAEFIRAYISANPVEKTN